MRKAIGLMLLFGIIVVSPLVFPASGELDNRNLKGVNYVRIRCEFNGVPFYKGVESPQAEKAEEFNAKEAENRLKELGIPISKDNIKAIYEIMESGLKKAGLGVVEIKNSPGQHQATIIPTVSVNVDILKASKELYFILVQLTVSKWISTWSGTENIHTPVIIWWQKEMLSAGPEELVEAVEKTEKQLIADFILRLKEAVEPPETEEKEGGEEKKQEVTVNK